MYSGVSKGALPEIFSSVGPEGTIAPFDTWGEINKGIQCSF